MTRRYKIAKSVAVERAAKAGSTISRKKSKAARMNGRLGGKPGDPRIAELMEREGLKSRQAAWYRLKKANLLNSR